MTCLRLPTLPITCPTLLPHPLLIHATHDITVVVKTVAQNPEVLAGWLDYLQNTSYKTTVLLL